MWPTHVRLAPHRLPHVALLSAFVALGGSSASPAAEPAPSRVSVGPVERRVFHLRIEILGEVEAVRRSRPSAEAEGLVESVLVDVGTPVEAGEALIRLSAVERQILRRAAEAQLRQAEEQLREYEAGNRPEEIRQAEEAMNAAKALLDEADDNLRRMESLHEKGTVSDQELTTARAKALSARGVYRERVAAYDLVKEGPRVEVLARAKAAVAQMQAGLDQIDDEIRKAEIVAPFAGVVTEKLVEKGDYVKRGDPVVALVQMDPIRVSLATPEAAINRLEKGSEIAVTLDALPGEELNGKVAAVVPDGDRLARTFPVKVDLPNPGNRLFPGMAARGVISLSAPEASLSVPADAIVRTEAGSVLVYAVREGRAVLVPVTPGITEGELVEVRGALEPGDQVIVRGNERGFPNTPDQILEEAPSAPGGAEMGVGGGETEPGRDAGGAPSEGGGS